MKLPVVILRITIPITMMVLVITLLFSYPYVNTLSSFLHNVEDENISNQYVIKETIKYLNNFRDDFDIKQSESSNISVFSDIEISHMEDVKMVLNSFRLFGFLSSIGAVSCFFIIRKNEQLSTEESLDKLYLLPTYISLFIGALVVIDFNTFFNLFHNIIFSNNTWLLSNDDVLIQLFPEPFWIISILITVVLWLLILFGLSKITFIIKKSNK